MVVCAEDVEAAVLSLKRLELAAHPLTLAEIAGDLDRADKGCSPD
ncbi:hypothetical protein ACQP2P_31210 [Dactylosporangium sp. CA-139114]